MTFTFDPERYSGLPLEIVHREIGSQIERLIEYLDNLDPYDEREPEYDGCELELYEGDGAFTDGGVDDEPSLGWTSQTAQIGGDYRGGNLDLEADSSDDEPWLGWTISGGFGNSNDLEHNGDEEDYSGHEDEGASHVWRAGGVEIAQGLIRQNRLSRQPDTRLVEIVSSAGHRAMLEVTL